jgi:hypothetical protein
MPALLCLGQSKIAISRAQYLANRCHKYMAGKHFVQRKLNRPYGV